MSLSSLPVFAYHGCDETTANDIINKKSSFSQSNKDYDWLGEGIYFWVGSYSRALDWANQKKNRGEVKVPSVICALVELRNCLNLTDFGMASELSASHSDLLLKLNTLGKTAPTNSGPAPHGVPLLRRLDCAVIQHIHQARRTNSQASYDTVLGAFEEGAPAFSGAAIKERSHIQLAVRNTSCILATFRH